MRAHLPPSFDPLISTSATPVFIPIDITEKVVESVTQNVSGSTVLDGTDS